MTFKCREDCSECCTSCIFLLGGLCLIYEYRPSICRNFGESESIPCIYMTPDGERRTKEDEERIRQHWQALKQQIAV